MPDLSFRIAGAAALPHAVMPTLLFNLEITNAKATEQIQSVLLQCQIRLESIGQGYNAGEQSRLKDPFGPAEQWSPSFRSLLWSNATLFVPAFSGSTVVDMPVTCTFDFSVTAAKYFAAQGTIRVLALFSGSVFYRPAGGFLQVAQIPCEKEAGCAVPVEVWKEMMQLYCPDSAWLCLRRETFDRLQRYKIDAGLPTWEAALEDLLCGGRWRKQA